MNGEVLHAKFDQLRTPAAKVLASVALLGAGMPAVANAEPITGTKAAATTALVPINRLPGYNLKVHNKDFNELQNATVSIGFSWVGKNWENISSGFAARVSPTEEEVLWDGHGAHSLTSATATVIRDLSVPRSVKAEYFKFAYGEYGVFSGGRVKTGKEIGGPQKGTSVAVNGNVDAAMLKLPNNAPGVTPISINDFYGKLVPGEQVAIENPNIKNASGEPIRSIGRLLGITTVKPFDVGEVTPYNIASPGIKSAARQRVACVEDTAPVNPFVVYKDGSTADPMPYSGDAAITPTGDLGPASGVVYAKRIPMLEQKLGVSIPRDANVECFTVMNPSITAALEKGIQHKHNFAYVG